MERLARKANEFKYNAVIDNRGIWFINIHDHSDPDWAAWTAMIIIASNYDDGDQPEGDEQYRAYGNVS